MTKSSYMTAFVCQFGRCRFPRLPFRVMQAGELLQQKIAEIFNTLLYVFGPKDDILIIDYNVDGMDQDKILK